MDAASAIAVVATGAGTFVGTMWAAWARMVKPLSDRVEEHAKATVTAEEFREVRDAIQALAGVQRELGEIKTGMRDMSEQLRHCVTDDEFASYTAQTTGLINGLTEKVGRATGVLEAWTQSRK